MNVQLSALCKQETQEAGGVGRLQSRVQSESEGLRTRGLEARGDRCSSWASAEREREQAQPPSASSFYLGLQQIG